MIDLDDAERQALRKALVELGVFAADQHVDEIIAAVKRVHVAPVGELRRHPESDTLLALRRESGWQVIAVGPNASDTNLGSFYTDDYIRGMDPSDGWAANTGRTAKIHEFDVLWSPVVAE